jgi:prevent-host-death family protein
MKTFAAKEAKDNFGRLLDTAQREPLRIAKNGRPVAVLLSLEEYERLEALDDAYWAARADEALQEGSLGPEASEAFIRQILDAAD